MDGVGLVGDARRFGVALEVDSWHRVREEVNEVAEKERKEIKKGAKDKDKPK